MIKQNSTSGIGEIFPFCLEEEGVLFQGYHRESQRESSHVGQKPGTSINKKDELSLINLTRIKVGEQRKLLQNLDISFIQLNHSFNVFDPL